MLTYLINLTATSRLGSKHRMTMKVQANTRQAAANEAFIILKNLFKDGVAYEIDECEEV